MPNVDYHLRTLGEFSLRRSVQPDRVLLRGSKPLMILALLALAPRLTARRDHVAALLWPNSDPVRARRSLRQALFYLWSRTSTRLVSGGSRKPTIELQSALVSVDVWEFERALQEREYETAVRVCRGEFLPGINRKLNGEVEHLIRAERARILSGLQVAYTRLVSARIEDGDTETAIGYARDYVAAHPTNDRAQTVLIQALRAGGYELEALGTYRVLRKLDRGPIAVAAALHHREDNGASPAGVTEATRRRRFGGRLQRALGRMAGFCGLAGIQAITSEGSRSR